MAAGPAERSTRVSPAGTESPADEPMMASVIELMTSVIELMTWRAVHRADGLSIGPCLVGPHSQPPMHVVTGHVRSNPTNPSCVSETLSVHTVPLTPTLTPATSYLHPRRPLLSTQTPRWERLGAAAIMLRKYPQHQHSTLITSIMASRRPCTLQRGERPGAGAAVRPAVNPAAPLGPATDTSQCHAHPARGTTPCTVRVWWTPPGALLSSEQ